MSTKLFRIRKNVNLFISIASGLLSIFIINKIIKDILYWQNPENIALQQKFPEMHYCDHFDLQPPLVIISIIFLLSIFFIFYLKNSNKKNITVLIIDVLLILIILLIIFFMENNINCF